MRVELFAHVAERRAVVHEEQTLLALAELVRRGAHPSDEQRCAEGVIAQLLRRVVQLLERPHRKREWRDQNQEIREQAERQLRADRHD